jgi:phage baseplate assembly protein W
MKTDFLSFPFDIGKDGRIAITDEEHHIQHLIHQVLFTNPGERVNVPDFGCGLKQLIFAPISDILTTTTQFTVSAALQKWLGHLITVENVQVKAEEEKLFVTITYTLLKTREKRQVQFSR